MQGWCYSWAYLVDVLGFAWCLEVSNLEMPGAQGIVVNQGETPFIDCIKHNWLFRVSGWKRLTWPRWSSQVWGQVGGVSENRQEVFPEPCTSFGLSCSEQVAQLCSGAEGHMLQATLLLLEAKDNVWVSWALSTWWRPANCFLGASAVQQCKANYLGTCRAGREAPGCLTYWVSWAAKKLPSYFTGPWVGWFQVKGRCHVGCFSVVVQTYDN